MPRTQPSVRVRNQRRVLFLLLAITLAGGLLRAYQIGSKSLWIDEAFSVWVARQPVQEMLPWLVRIDQHPPLYYLLLHFWLRADGAVGGDGAARNSAAMVRLLSALVSTLSIPPIYRLGQRLGGQKVGLLVALILALSPFHVRFAQEARMYALLNFNASLSMLALVHLLTSPPLNRSFDCPFDHAQDRTQDRPCMRGKGGSALPRRNGGGLGRGPAWTAYVLCTAAAMWTHNAAILFFVAVNLFVFGLALSHRRWPAGRIHDPPHTPSTGSGQSMLVAPPARNWLAAQLGVLLLWSPWLKPFIAQTTAVYREFWIPAPTWGSVASILPSFLSAFLPQRIGWAAVVWCLYGATVLLGAYRLRRRLAILALLASLFITPIAGELLVSLRRPIFYDRTLIWASIPLYLLLALGIRQLRYRSYVLAAVAILVTVNLLSLREYFGRFEKEQWDDAAAYVAQRVQDGDLILFHATWVQLPFDFYFHSDRSVAEHGVPVDLFDRGVLEPKMTQEDLPRLRDLIRSRDRVWLVYSHDWYTDPESLVPAALAKDAELLDRRRFYGLEVRLYGASSR